MKPERIGKIIRVVPKAGIDELASECASSRAPPEQELDMICREVEPPENIQATAPAAAEMEDFDENPKLKRFRAKQLNQVEYKVDVAFMENVIGVLIDNHDITITPKDIRDILTPFGDAVVKTQMIPVQSGSVDEDLNCCGCSKKQQQEAVEVVKSIALNGLSLAKHIPDLLGFLGKIGISI
jgi:hypothetical protein